MNNKKNATQQMVPNENENRQRQLQQAWQEAQAQTVQNTTPSYAQKTTANQTSVQQPNTVQQKPTQQKQEPKQSYSYDNNTDYQSLINAADAAENYQLAAIYEQQRNSKIANEGLDYEQTNKYASYLPANEPKPQETIESSDNDSYSPSDTDLPEQSSRDLSELINQLYDEEAKRIRTEQNYEIQSAADQLNRALQDAQPTYEAAIANQLLEAKQAQDAQALRNQINGDRGGIGSAQVASIGNTGAKNREAIAQQQRQLATDTARQIADLRARGKYQEANLLLQNSQQKLSALYEEQVRLQQEDEARRLQKQQEEAAQKEFLSSLGMQYLQAGKVPPDSLLGAMGIDRQTAQGYADLMREQIAASQTQKSGNGGNGGSGDGSYYGDDYSGNPLDGFTQYSSYSELGTNAQNLLNSFSKLDSHDFEEGNMEKINNKYLAGEISLSEAAYILKAIGIGDGSVGFAEKYLQTVGA